MKRIVSIMMSIILLASTSLGATFTQVANGSSISIDVAQGTAVTIKALDIFGKIFSGWTISGATVSNPSLAEQTITMPSGNVTATANYTNASGGSGSSGGGSVRVNADTSGANAPVLGAGMTPVNWDGGNWVETTQANWKYNYNSVANNYSSKVEGNGDGAWANAINSDGSVFVWIPRYSYKISGCDMTSTNPCTYSWSRLNFGPRPYSQHHCYNCGNQGTRVYVKFSSGTSDFTTGSYSDYIAHPAFSFGDRELRGIWVSKYVVSDSDSNSYYEGSTNVFVSLPNKLFKEFDTVHDAYTSLFNYDRDLDSHLLKHTEWGTIALLANAIGHIPSRPSHDITGTGLSDSNVNWGKNNPRLNGWSSFNGVGASTTCNIYGVYDMCQEQWVSQIYTNGKDFLTGNVDSNAAIEVAMNTPGTAHYVNVETNWADGIGDALYECYFWDGGNRRILDSCSMDYGSDTRFRYVTRGCDNNSDSNSPYNTSMWSLNTKRGPGADGLAARICLAIE